MPNKDVTEIIQQFYVPFYPMSICLRFGDKIGMNLLFFSVISPFCFHMPLVNISPGLRVILLLKIFFITSYLKHKPTISNGALSSDRGKASCVWLKRWYAGF